MKYVVSSAARDDLLTIWEYSAQKWDLEQADLYIDTLIIRFAWLVRNQGLWHSRDELGTGICSYPEGSHIIIFRQVEASLQILRVLHASMDLDRHDD